MPNNPLNIGLILCYDIDPSDQAEYGTYTRMFQDSLDPLAQTIALTPINCLEGESLPAPQDFAGYIITGSRASVYDDLPWITVLQAFIRQCWDEDIKIVGICFGHQLIAHSLGGKTEKAKAGWGFGIHSTRLSEKRSWMTGTESLDDDCYNLIVIHQDQVVDVPPQFKTIASSNFCPNSMIVAENKMLGIQGHPEFNKNFCQSVAERRKATIGPEVYKSTLHSLAENDTHAKTVLTWVNNFLHQPSGTS